MNEYTIKTTKEQRQSVKEEIHALGIVTDNWKDGSFDFKPYDTDCENDLIEILDALNVEYRMN